MSSSSNFPGLDLVQQEIEYLKTANVGDSSTPFVKVSNTSQEVDDHIQKGIQYDYNIAAWFDSANAYFDRDNVALPGVALFFKVAAVAMRNNAQKKVDFLNKRGTYVQFGPIAAPPSSWSAKDCSDVTGAFVFALGSAKVAYAKIQEAAQAAVKAADIHAQDFLGNLARQQSESQRIWSHYVAHLKVVENDKHAIKEFDRTLPLKVQDLAYAAAIESVIPNRLIIGADGRATAHEAQAVEGKGWYDTYARAVYALSATT